MKNKLRLIFGALFALLFGAVTLSATTVFWIAPNGRDDATGTQEQPFASPARAIEALRAHVGKGLQDDVAVRFRSGIYRLNQTLELTSAELGDGNQRITFSSVPGERAVLAGSRELSGVWRQIRENLWALKIEDARDGRWVFRSLFRAGESLPRAREPDDGYYTIAAVTEERRRLKLNQPIPAAWHDLKGIEINSTAHWHFNRQPAAAIDGTSVQGFVPIGTDVSSSRITEKSHSRIWLENALAFADTPGEWFLDSTAGEIYYAAKPGEDPNHVRFSAPVLRELIVVRGSSDRLVRNLHFRELEFAETDWEMPSGGRLGIQAGAWASDRSRTYSPGAALRFIYASATTVEGCKFRDLGDGAISYEIGTSQGLVSRCDFLRVGSNAVQIGRIPEYTGDGHPLHRDFASTQAWLDEMKKLPPSREMWLIRSRITPEAPSQIEIADNTFLDCGYLDYGSVAVCITYAHHITVEHNLFRDLPYSAINVGWRWAPGPSNCHSNLIRRNRIEHVMLQAGDGSGIYLVGEQPGTRVLENYVNDSGRNYWAHGIYGDECSDHMEIAGNYVTGVMDHSIFMNKNGPNQLLRNNNGESGPTAITGANTVGGKWVKFTPERTPPDLSKYGPRRISIP
jgi:hypothetical protein